MANIFFGSDPHFGHANMMKFIVHALDCPKRLPGLNEGATEASCDCPKMRPFASVEEMDEFMVQEHNKIVRPPDKFYCLGDVAIGKNHIKTIGRLNGHKRLVRGNHDIFPDKYYTPFFESIYGSRVFEDMILTHIPIHPESLKQKWTNVHGHVHNNVPALHFGVKYLNISVEVTDYRPLAIEEVRQRIRDQKAENQRLVEANLARLGVKRLWTDEELRRER
jgi:calcineurin-like phosphoesterase family protein